MQRPGYHEVLANVRALALDLTETISAGQPPTNTGLMDSSDVKAACLRLPNLLRNFQQGADELDKAFNGSERIWVEEHRKQEGLARAADQAVR